MYLIIFPKIFVDLTLFKLYLTYQDFLSCGTKALLWIDLEVVATT